MTERAHSDSWQAFRREEKRLQNDFTADTVNLYLPRYQLSRVKELSRPRETPLRCSQDKAVIVFCPANALLTPEWMCVCSRWRSPIQLWLTSLIVRAWMSVRLANYNRKDRKARFVCCPSAASTASRNLQEVGEKKFDISLYPIDARILATLLANPHLFVLPTAAARDWHPTRRSVDQIQLPTTTIPLLFTKSLLAKSFAAFLLRCLPSAVLFFAAKYCLLIEKECCIVWQLRQPNWQNNAFLMSVSYWAFYALNLPSITWLHNCQNINSDSISKITRNF